ncbi:TetR/AcrR family transcriptional regulator [Streptomyces sp. BE20]|uniref:TetR/AcrR family transcriptional regulator n=1 Tax=Streptomyces sp. BE20 TaxID=3002525 RepID=UPI002E76EA97|nr:TetR/AcrR family transcriptional regulator [Streptomyces sp. BE20]MEE1824755.1 TetR/AcrR family transcriptional regulator [Streptomyces sp. BE20]
MIKQERARRTREKVLDAAAEEFSAQGYSRATLNAVAQRTGMTKGALYGHFASKRLLAGALLLQSRKVWEEMRQARDVPGAAAGAVLESLVLDLAHRLKEDVRLRAALRLATDCPALAQMVPDIFEDVQRGLANLIRRAQGEGSMAPRPPELVAQLLLAVMHGAPHVSFGPPGACGSAGAYEAAWRLLLEALAGPPAGTAGAPVPEGGTPAGCSLCPDPRVV